MMMNVGSRVIEEAGEVLGYKGKVWCDNDSMANIFSFAELADQCHITYDNKVDDPFHIEMSGKKVHFPRSSEGLYFYKMNDKYKELVKSKNNGTSLVTMVKENLEGFLENQIERATEAKRLYHKVGALTVENFKYLIKGNMIQNCLVTVDDINNMHKI